MRTTRSTPFYSPALTPRPCSNIHAVAELSEIVRT